MDRNPENHVLSLRLSRVFEDIGVTGQMVNRRRRTWLATEKFNNVVRHFFENTTRTKYTFGSQSEGSTTLGMNSDVDMLDCKSTPVLIDLTEWKPGRDCLLVLKNENSPPQHCNLQLIRPDLPMPITLDLVQDRVDVEVDGEGKVLLKNTNWDPYIKRLYRDEYVQQGPSRSGSKNIDIVNAYHCFSLLEECQILFKRPRPGHWPRPAIMTQAKATGTFLIPQGHAESHYPKIEWRFSTSIIERLLMFDLDTIKLKVYICLKMLRKTYFKPIVGDRLSTFHFKTALLFTIETYPPEIWQEHNLVQCVIYCLTTLERWCRMSHCPHYTISGVDLFVGKLKRFELPRIATILLDMRENLMVYVVHIEMDQLGKRMLRLSETSCGLPIALPTRHENILSIVMTCFHNLLTGFLTEPFFYNLNTSNISRFLDDCKLDAMYTYMLFTQDGTSYFSDVFGLYIKFLSSTLATTLASRCIELQQPITAKVYNLYRSSLDSDLTSSRLKFASMLYCTGQYEKAAVVLEHAARLLHPDVLQFFFSNRADSEFTRGLQCKLLEMPAKDVIMTSVALCVAFHPQELYCVPKHLVFEMHRTFSKEDRQTRHPVNDSWMDYAVIGSIPFLYYLQYLTHRQLGQTYKQVEALRKLLHYTNHDSDSCGHIETVTNVLGHCYELENRLDHALRWYTTSLEALPNNNAASWHIAILLSKLVNEP